MNRLLGILLVLINCFDIAAQTSIINDESQLRFFTGTFDEGIQQEAKVYGRHTLMTDTTLTDPYTDGEVKVVAPGSNLSYRLGNDRVGAQAERISYTLKVTPETSLFVYQYAVVMEDPAHEPWEQPKFEITVTNQGEVFDEQCGYYKVISAEHIPGFKSIGNIRYKDWTSVGIDLSRYMGETVTIEFTTFDCQRKAHFGYSYFNAFYGKLELKVKYCEGDEFAEIIAPPGFNYEWHPTGQTSRRIKVTSKNLRKNYTCTITSVTGCGLTLPTELQINRALLKVKTETSNYRNGFNVSCHGENDGSIKVKVSGGYPPYRIEWQDGSNELNRSGLSANSYHATIWDQVGCSKEISLALTEPEPVVAEIKKTDVSCHGGSDGTISLLLNDAASDKYKFLWSHGATSNHVTNLSVGTYQVQVSNKSKCSTFSVTLTEPEEISVTKEVSPVTCHGSADGLIKLQVSGGVPPYDFTWDRRGLSGPEVSNLSLGMYNVTISDQNGCRVVESIEITGPPSFAVDYSTSDYNGFEICCHGDANGSIHINSISGGLPPYNIRWSDGSLSDTRAELKAGAYEVVITDQKGCDTKLTINLRQPPPLRVKTYLETAKFLITLKQLQFTAVGGVPPYNYQVTKDGELIKTDLGKKMIHRTTRGGLFASEFVDINGCQAQASKTILQRRKIRPRRDKPNMYVKDVCKPGN